MRTSTKITAAVGGAALTLATAGVAYAYWTTTGSGAGSATTGTTSDFTITNAATTGTALSPNGPTQTATFNVHNPGSGAQKANTVVVSIANSDGTPWTAVSGCSASDYSVGGELADVSHSITVNQVLAAGGDSTQQSVTVKMLDTGSDQNGCKGAAVPLYYAVS